MIPLINEVQYRSMFLNEERHYPKFLDNLKDDVSIAIGNHAIEMIKHKKLNDTFVFHSESKYVKNITIKITINENGDISDPKSYSAFYFNRDPKLIDGKLNNPTLTVSFPFKGKKFDYMYVRFRVAHEITHLYDDWNSIRLGHGCICSYPNNNDTTEFLRRADNLGNDLFKDIAMMSYMSLKTEKQAFISQTIQELESLKCNQRNYREKLKKTTLYGNIRTSYENVVNGISSAEDQQLYLINYYIMGIVPNASVPKLNTDDFNAIRYRSMLIKWAKRTYHTLMKSYGSVVQYYLEEYQRKQNSNRTYFQY